MRKGSNIKLAALALVGLGVVMSSGAYAMDGMKVSSQGGISAMKSEDAPYWFKVGGLLQLDQVFAHGSHQSDQGYPNSANLRRARLRTEGGLGCHWSYYFGLDLAGPRMAWDNVYITYAGLENTDISIGKISPPMFLSNQTGTANVLTLERPAVMQAFVPADGLGIYLDHQLEMLAFEASVWAPQDGATSGSFASGFSGSDLLGFSGRMTFSPVHTADNVWHMGVSGMYLDLHDKNSGTFALSTPTEIVGRSNPGWPSLVSTNMANPTNTVKYWTAAGVEAAALWGPFSVQAEYVGAHVSRLTGNANQSYKGWYANVAYSLTGESKTYDFAGGVFGAVQPAATTGAWEVFAQYSMLDLKAHSLGSIEHDATAGVNWYLNDNLRVTAEYSRANMSHLSAAPDKRKLDLFGLRLQAKWN